MSPLKYNETIKLEAWKDENNKQNQEPDPAVFLQNQREEMDFHRQRKRETWT